MSCIAILALVQLPPALAARAGRAELGLASDQADIAHINPVHGISATATRGLLQVDHGAVPDGGSACFPSGNSAIGPCPSGGYSYGACCTSPDDSASCAYKLGDSSPCSAGTYSYGACCE